LSRNMAGMAEESELWIFQFESEYFCRASLIEQYKEVVVAPDHPSIMPSFTLFSTIPTDNQNCKVVSDLSAIGTSRFSMAQFCTFPFVNRCISAASIGADFGDIAVIVPPISFDVDSQ
jgi:hypothetical protein